jgi:glycogen operon protein
MSPSSRHLAFYLDGRSQDDADLYVMINAHEKDQTFQIQEYQPGRWHLVCDTSRSSPEDIHPLDRQPPVTASHYPVAAQSVVVLVRPRPPAIPANAERTLASAITATQESTRPVSAGVS